MLNIAVEIPAAEATVPHSTYAHIEWYIPSAWRLLSIKDSLALKKEKQIALYHIFVPSYTLAQTYNVQYNLRIGNSTNTHQIMAVVEATHQVNINFSNLPKFQHENDTSIVELRIENASNIACDIELNLSIDGKKSTKLIPLKALSTTNVPIQIYAEGTLQHSHAYHLYANAQVLNQASTKSYAHASTLILPKTEKAYDQMLRLPSFVGVSYFRHKTQSGTTDMWQYEAFGKGFTNESQTKELEYHFKGPGTEHISSLAGYEEYYMKYNSPVLEVVAGDHTYHLSKLTEYSRYGRGISATAKLGAWQAGGFYLQPRFYPSLKHEWAAFAAYQIKEKHSIKLNHLQKTLVNEDKPNYLSSIETHLQAFRKTQLEMEYAWSKNTLSRTGHSMRFDVYSRYFKRLSLSAFMVQASKDFAGYYNNSLFYGTNLQYQFIKQLSFSFNLNKTKYNMALDTVFVSAPERQNITAGLQYQFNALQAVLLQYGYYTSKDRLLQQRFNYDEYFVSAQYHYGNHSFTSHSELKLSQVYNHLNHSLQETGQSAYHISTNLNYKFTDKLSAGAFASLSHHNKYQQKATNYFYYGGSFSAAIAQKTFAYISAQNSFTVEDDYLDRSYFQADIRHFFNKHHQFIFRSRYVLPRQEIKKAEWEIALQYRYHFGLPVNKKREQLCHLSGRISCENTSSDIDCSNILLHLGGKSTYTDENGYYEFKNIKKGEYYLLIDPSAMGVNTIPDQAEPMKVILMPDEDNLFDIKLQEAATVKAKFFIEDEDSYQIDNKTSTALSNINKLTQGMPRMIIELSNGKDTYRILNEADGTFTFKRLMPGNWQLKIYDQTLPTKLKLQKNTWQLQLNANEIKEMHIPIQNKKIKIRYKKSSASVSLNR